MTAYIVGSGQTRTGLVVNAKDSVTVKPGGTIDRTVVLGGANTIDGGTAIDTTLLNGGFEDVEHNGVSRGAIAENNASVGVTGDGAMSGAIIESGGSAYLEDEMTSTGRVLAGTPTDIGTLIDGGVEGVGSEYQNGIGVSSNDTIENGGIQYLWGLARGTIVGKGGDQVVYHQAVGTIVKNGGVQTISGADGYGGETFGTILEAGGEQDLSRGTTHQTIINTGATEDVHPGFFALADGSIISGGTMIVEATDAGELNTTGGIQFKGPGGVLDLGGTALPTTRISGLVAGDRIDLQDFGFNSKAKLSFSPKGALTIKGLTGGTATLTLDPGTLKPGMAFKLASDGHSGTNLTVQAASHSKMAAPDLASLSATASHASDPLGLRAAFSTPSASARPASSAAVAAATPPDLAGGLAHALSVALGAGSASAHAQILPHHGSTTG